jgi:hypothetical protein
MLTRTATAAAAGTALLALSAAPAGAMEVPEPGAKPAADTAASTTSSDDTPWMEYGLGALGGLVLAGAGVAAASTVRHRHSAHPA